MLIKSNLVLCADPGNQSTEISTIDNGASASVPLSLGVRFGQAIGASLAMRALFARLERLVSVDETVLLTGESGTGKELLARGLHALGRRQSGAFGILDCASLASNLIEAELFGHARGAFTGAANAREGVFELASGGTVFIDEIGELPLELQGKLLRVLEQRAVRRLGENDWRSVDVRVVAATHRNLRAMVKQGLFREDLYYRLAVVSLKVPSLRERPEDISLLVDRFLSEYKPPKSIDDLPPSVLQWLASHEWPGNVRELRNTVARMVLFPEESPALDVEGGVEKESSNADPWARLPLKEARELMVESFERRIWRPDFPIMPAT
jgi:transcriptional regulator with PAS, ATPase and Fis domain